MQNTGKMKKEKVKQKGLEFSYNLEDDLWGICIREGRKKEGRKEGRGGWSLGKNLEQESGCSVVNALCAPRHVHCLFPICPIFIIPYQLTRLLVRLKGKSVKIKNGVPVEFNKSL